MTLGETQTWLKQQLSGIYDTREAANITDLLLEKVTGKKKIDRLLQKNELPGEEIKNRIHSLLAELLAHRPIQYVLGEAWFASMPFFVNESVLIPRPETEELVNWIFTDHAKEPGGKKLLDIGTGSGCIPITLKKKLPGLDITAIDISEDALAVASQNAGLVQNSPHFIQMDFLVEKNWEKLPVFDIIVSNPPYIKGSEKNSMQKNVLAYEPSLALFVPDEDALLFYRKTLLFADNHLATDGSIYFEINEQAGNEMTQLLTEHGYVSEMKKDLQGKNRMIKAWKTDQKN